MTMSLLFGASQGKICCVKRAVVDWNPSLPFCAWASPMPSTSGFCSSTASNACVGVSNKRQPSAVQAGSATAATGAVDPVGAAAVIGGAGAGAAAGGSDSGAGSAPDGCDPAQPLPSTQQAKA